MPTTVEFEGVELSDAWIEGDESARWRSTAATGPSTGANASGASLLEVPPGCRLPRHTDSAEETVVVVTGRAEVDVGGQTAEVQAGGLALIPRDVPHEVRNKGQEPLRFVAVYASNDVMTTYEQPVQPDGEQKRKSTK